MAFYKKIQQPVNKKWYPRSIVVGDPATTDEVAQRLADISTVSLGDTYNVLKNLSTVLKAFMKEGRSVKLDGVGTFYYTADATKQGVDTAEEVSAKQIVGVRVRFLPEYGRTRHPVARHRHPRPRAEQGRRHRHHPRRQRRRQRRRGGRRRLVRLRPGVA